MDNLDDSENNAKISDSAYSNSCSNSQSRRSHSSKSTHSESNSSGSSGYGGKPSTSGYSDNINQALEKREKEMKKKKKVITEESPSEVKREFHWPPAPVFETPKEDNNDVDRTPPASSVQVEKGAENIDNPSPDQSSGKDETSFCNVPIPTSVHVTDRRHSAHITDGFSCVISMQDGVVMYTASSITTALGYPKDMWIGRSFIEFVHPRDHNTFASQITSGLSVPKKDSCTDVKAPALGNHVCSMVCRIRRYRGFTSGFGVKDKMITFMPFTLKFYFKNIKNEDGQAIYLVIKATPFFSAFKTPNEVVPQAVPFVIRHSANGCLEYIDPESVSYLGYLPQDIVNKDALQLYHPSDLFYLRHVYETIVREGAVPRSKPYRMLAQNGHYLKLETEWSSFINPWSKKLEFVTGKHYIIEGPTNPDVFQSPEFDFNLKRTEEDRSKSQALRQNILRIMNEVLTKPAEAAKQQMSKRCQDLASFMETLIEETPKGEDELRLDVQDADNSYCERDSVMLGGVSPHHDCKDSMSSTETPISYNQLNYNETLQRYFDSHGDFEEYEMPGMDTKLEIQKPGAPSSNYMSSLDCSSWDNVEGTSASDSSAVILPISSQNSVTDGYQQVRLTESLLNKHNAEMEKDLAKVHRENRSSKSDRDKSSCEIRQKIKEHLARCNVLYPSTDAAASTLESQRHGTKRASKQSEEVVPHKHRCHSPRFHNIPSCTANAIASNTARSAPWPAPQLNNMNAIILGVGIPQPMSMVSPVQVPGVFPMYYTPTINQPRCSTATSNSTPNNAHFQGFGHPVNTISNVNLPCSSAAGVPRTTSTGIPCQPPHQMPCMMFGQAVYGSPIMYSTINPQMYAMQPNCVTSNMENAHPLRLPDRNYEERSEPSSTQERKKRKLHRGTSADKTDEESSYSSFYSSFFKTDSGSTEESDVKNKDEAIMWQRKRRASSRLTSKNIGGTYKNEPHPTKVSRLEQQVCLTSELIYKYQVLTKNLEEVLSQDREKLKKIEQPSLVNEQLGQLYLDLQLEGVAARLTLEEGITSSSSSGEETTTKTSKTRRRKREYSKLVMIYEENAPLPPPQEDTASSSTS